MALVITTNIFRLILEVPLDLALNQIRRAILRLILEHVVNN